MIKDPAKVFCDTRVEKIWKDHDRWVIHDGKQDRVYDRLVLAFPVMDAISCFENVPDEVLEAVANLRFNALRLAFIAVNNESLMDKSAVYIPDPTVQPHRVCYMGFFSPNVVKLGTSSLVAETTTRPGDRVDTLSNDNFLDLVVGDLDRVGIIHKEDVIVRDTRRIGYAYPVYDRAHGKNTGVLRKWFASMGIEQLGRFAEFDYINSDECIHRAMQLAKKLNAVEESAMAAV